MAKKSGAKQEDASGRKLVASNKKARHDYHIEDTFEAGKGVRWTFTWAPADPRKGDEFKVLLSGDGVEPTPPEYTDATSKTLTVKRNATVCVQVALSREGGQTSALSKVECVTGR